MNILKKSRRLSSVVTTVFGVIVTSSSLVLSALATGERSAPDSEDSLRQLIAGNKRYSEGLQEHPNQDSGRRSVVAKAQEPFAAVLGCVDSRVAPEVLFDQGIGDIFTVRIAGHVLDNTSLGSLEYAAEHLGISVIVVLGHERCGAVKAAVDGGHLPGHLTALTERIKPVIQRVSSAGAVDVEKCISENSRYVADQIRNAPPVIKEMVQSGKIKVVAAKYDLDTGVVEFY